MARNYMKSFFVSTYLFIPFVLCSICWGGDEVENKVFMVGGDISMLSKIEELGGRFRENGIESDFLTLTKKHGWNICRLRIFVNPNHQGAVVNDLTYTLALAQRIKAAGFRLLLNFHYSDTWADPGHQNKPKAWSDLGFQELELQVEDYTASVIDAFQSQGILPDWIQIGNEITPGMLWPEGRVGGAYDSDTQWDQFTRLLKAGIRGARKPLSPDQTVRIMLHIDKGGDAAATKWFFDRIQKYDVPYDLIGLSFYPWWHGSLNALKKTLDETARIYDKDIVVVETAYPQRNTTRWSKEKNMDWPVSPEGQFQFLTDVVQSVRETPNHRGIGVIYWYPESIPVEGIHVWNGGEMAVFDASGNILPAAKAFQPQSVIERFP